MPLASFESYPLWLNLAVFVIAAIVVWVAGTRLAGAADTFAERTGIGRAFVGALLLGGITSLPEATTTITAVAIGNPQLAINNILGGVAMQVVVLVVADASLRRESLAPRVNDSAVLLEATFLILVLTLAAGGLFFGDYKVLGFGLWTLGIFASSTVALYLLHNARNRQPWMPKRPNRETGAQEKEQKNWVWVLIGCSAAIVLAGIVLTQSADALAIQTGMHAGFIGAVTLALATSLPEISTMIGAVRLKRYAMAYSNIFGANLLDLSLLFVADLVYVGEAVLNHGGTFAAGVALLGILLTAVTLAGLIERRRVVILGIGVDSLIVVIVYLAGLGLLYGQQ